MIEKLVQSFYTFWASRKKTFSILFLLVCAFLAFGIAQLNISEDIYSILPKGKSFEKLNNLASGNDVRNKVFFLISVEEEKNQDELTETIDSLTQLITQKTNASFVNFTSSKEDLQKDIYDYYYTHFPLLLDSSYYQLIDEKIEKKSVEKSIHTTYRQIISPSGGFLKNYILNDPIFITQPFFSELEKLHSGGRINIKDGFMFSKDGGSIFIYANIKSNTTAAEKETLYYNLQSFKAEWNTKHPTNQVDYFGTFQIATENSIQVKKDTKTTLIIAVIAILLILILYYRKVSAPIYFILPTLFGGLFALGIMGYLQPNVSGLSIATGAILFGIAMDYSFHFFTHYAHTKSLLQTLKEISIPLVTGSFTTILAFAALIFANSVILQDFGLFATLALIGASLFTLLFLPLILTITGFNVSSINREKELFKLPSLNKKYHPYALIAIVIITIILFYSSKGIQFDSDLNNLSYHQESLKEKEEKFVGMNPDEEVKLHLFSYGNSLDDAAESNYKLYKKIKDLKTKGLITEFFSTGDFIIPKSVQKTRIKTWNDYWSNKSTSTFSTIDSTAKSIGFNSNAFGNFKSWLTEFEAPTGKADSLLLNKMELNTLVRKDKDGKVILLSSVIVNKQDKERIKAELLTINGIEIFDRADMASSLVDLVKDDFNYLLFASFLIVFITLLIIYGRLELTLLTVLPMIIGWIWILGIASLLDIKFNFVNIVIATFIFGLGDDFSIFVSDGLMAKYKFKKNNLKSYNTAIILSAITTIIGTGVLIFAKHPAIHSVALISVLGIVLILLISLVVQPIIFNFFVQGRIEKGKPPITFFAFFLTTYSFTLFIVGSLAASVFLLFFRSMPIGRKRKQLFINHILSKLAWLQIYTGYQITKRIDTQNLDISKPSIIISNHASFLDILLLIMLSPRIVLVVKDWVYKSPLFGSLIRYAGYIYIGDSPEENLEKVSKLIADGYSIGIFPEGTRSEDGNMKRFHKGAFFLADQLGLDITPIMVHGVYDTLPKSDLMINISTISLKVLPRIKHEDPVWGENYSQKTKSVSKYFKREFSSYKNQQEDALYFSKIIFRNYVFKGPLLEWYFKIKWGFESKNYTFYNKLIGNRTTIMDVGCGYGYLSYFLHFRNENREILALDYDEDKIAIAKNAYNITENLQFEAADIVSYPIPKREVIFYNDVLHYLPEEEQLIVLKKSIESLDQNGILFIRDGITDLKDRHKKTIETERYSTQIIGFNKKTRNLHFFSSEFIKNLAEEYGLSFEMIEQSKKTSNVLIILRKTLNGE